MLLTGRKDRELRLCVDRILPEERPLPIDDRLTVRTRMRWRPGTTLHVRFLGGEPDVHARVAEIAARWMDHANVRFEFGARGDAVIRIAFTPGASWSLVGIDAQAVRGEEATMNFGWLTAEASPEDYERVVLHEFGHALGCIHEHQSPAAGIPWNRRAVLDLYTAPPYEWTPEEVEQNIFSTYAAEITQFTAFDRESIMLYPIPRELTDGVFEAPWNTKLSATDVEFIGTIYPQIDPALPRLQPGGDPVAGEIAAPGAIAEFWFALDAFAEVIVETTGRTDLALRLLGPDSAQTLAGRDPGGGGLGGNARVSASLMPGAYLVRIAHQRPDGTGPFQVALR
jgi:hypothetical protein